MKTLKLKKGPIIAILVMCAAFLIVGIVFALLPEEVYESWGDSDWEHSRYTALIVCGVVDFILLFSLLATVPTQDRHIKHVNEMMSNMGEDALILNGAIIDAEASSENTKSPIRIILIGLLAVFFWLLIVIIWGVCRCLIGKSNKDRTFILCREGLYVINMRDGTELLLRKEKIQKIIITENDENSNSLGVFLLPGSAHYSVNTKGLDITQEELVAKFKEVFNNSEQAL